MTLDHRLTQAARQVAQGLRAPAVDVEAIRARSRRNRRRRAVLVVAATTVVGVLAVSASLLGRETAAPDPVVPSPTPTITPMPTPSTTEKPNPFPRSMTPQQVVDHPRAQLWTAAVAPDDPDTRMSLWFVQCLRPCRQDGPSQFDAMALTTDGYDTSTVVRPGITLGVDLQVSSPVSGTFLVVDMSNGGEWLVDTAGTVRRVTHVATELSPPDPRLWFQCVGQWRHTWCSLDPVTAAAHEWPRVWDGSAVRPTVGGRPWGTNPRPRATSASGNLEAWWDTGQGRQLRTLVATHRGDYILDTPPGEMAHWAMPDGSLTLDIYTSRNGGADWEVDRRTGPVYSSGGLLLVRRSPAGAYLATSTWPTLSVWRADETGGPFRLVYEQPAGSVADTSGAGLWTQDGIVYANSNATAAISYDDGLTWTSIQTWK